ncbi:MAG: hypothetical protein KC457_07365 [Myxococcales bacterium]|nr:hypothetical protein [Myxococcales bacterium]
MLRTNITILGAVLLAGCPADDTNDDEVGDVDGTNTSTDADETATSVGDTATTDDTATGDTATGDTGTDTTTGGDACQDGVVANLTLEESFASAESGWSGAERWRIDSPAIPDDPFFPDARSEQAGQQLEFYGLDPTPDPNKIVIQYSPGWDSAPGNPVLLVHGADDPPDRAWANPNMLGPYGCGDMVCPDEGLMQGLVDAGIPVFAIAFPNTQGDNFMWIEQIEAAVQVIREQTCADKVDLIGWSKGAFAARMYATGMHADWGEAHGQDIRKLILIGGPNLGFDYLFRYGSGNNSSVWPPGMAHGPTPHHTQLVGLQEIDRSEYAVYETAGGYYFRGQAQMQAMWVDTYPLVFFSNSGFGPVATIDTLSTYWGEDQYQGLLAKGKGIEFTIAQGSLVQEIVDAGIPASVDTYLLCGEITSMDAYIPGIPNEIAGPSDGVVFLESCGSGDGVGKLAELVILEDVNHLELGWKPEAQQKIVEWLNQ